MTSDSGTGTPLIEYAPTPPRRRSKLGVASLAVAIAAVPTFFAVFSMIEGRPASDLGNYKILSLALILPVAGAVLGVVAVCQRGRYRALPIAALATNVLLALFVLLIIVPALVYELTR